MRQQVSGYSRYICTVALVKLANESPHANPNSDIKTLLFIHVCMPILQFIQLQSMEQIIVSLYLGKKTSFTNSTVINHRNMAVLLRFANNITILFYTFKQQKYDASIHS